MTGQGDHEGVGACAEEQFVVGEHITIVCCDSLCVAVNVGDLFAKPAGDVMLCVPSIVMSHDVLVRLISRQNGRQHDAVIVAARFRVEKRHRIIAARIEQMLQRAAGGHTCTDNDKFLCHGLLRRDRCWLFRFRFGAVFVFLKEVEHVLPVAVVVRMFE